MTFEGAVFVEIVITNVRAASRGDLGAAVGDHSRFFCAAAFVAAETFGGALALQDVALVVGGESRRIGNEIIRLDLAKILLETAAAEEVVDAASAKALARAALGLELVADGAREGGGRGHIFAEQNVFARRAAKHRAFHAE